MPKEIAAVVPVAPAEPRTVIERSVEAIRDLRAPDGTAISPVYIIDTPDADGDDRVAWLQEQDGIAVVVREPGEGRRAGAINAGMDHAGSTAYVAVFDVDSRPEPDFLERTVPHVGGDTFFATAPREVVNSDTNMVTRMVDTEFRFFSDMQRLLTHGNGFFHANGLIGVLDGDYARSMRFDPSKLCADTDLSERAYADRKHAHMVTDTAVGEQAVTSLRDLYNQKQRWLQGAIEGVRHHTRTMLGGPAAARIKLSWLLTMMLPFVTALFSPLAFGYALVRYGNRPTVAVRRGVGFALLTVLVTVAGAGAIAKNVVGDGVGWTVPEREPI